MRISDWSLDVCSSDLRKSVKRIFFVFSDSKFLLFVVVAAVLAATGYKSAQAETIPPETFQLLQNVVGNRVEATDVLGGQEAISGGAYLRSEELRVGKECVIRCSSWWAPNN